MTSRCFLSAVARIAPFEERAYSVAPRPLPEWNAGDYVVCRVEDEQARGELESPCGRMLNLARGDRLMGALGRREATVESTGDWRAVDDSGDMHILSAGGLVGRCTSTSPFLAMPVTIRYEGHVVLDGEIATMRRFVVPAADRAFVTPTIVLVGTSMSSGKTRAGEVLVRRLALSGRRVLAAKLTGAARYRDVLSMGDAGAEWVRDFVDAGFPSTVVPEDEFRRFTREFLARMAELPADVAVIEVGASPLEPYNGTAALEALTHVTRAIVLAASDGYAARGLMDAAGLQVDLVCGPAANTRAGIVFTERISGVATMNLTDPSGQGALDRLLEAWLESESRGGAHSMR